MDTKLLTAEDPVDEIEGIMQVPVNHQVGLIFRLACLPPTRSR